MEIIIEGNPKEIAAEKCFRAMEHNPFHGVHFQECGLRICDLDALTFKTKGCRRDHTFLARSLIVMPSTPAVLLPHALPAHGLFLRHSHRSPPGSSAQWPGTGNRTGSGLRRG